MQSAQASAIHLPVVERAESPPLDDAQSVPVMFKWTHGGHRVSLTGTFNNWASAGIPMVRSEQEFYQVVQVPKGVHEYKFLVDGEWKFSLEQPVLQDVSGNVNNVVDIQYYEKYEPAPLRDPLELDEEGEPLWSQELLEPAQAEPPSAPPLLVRLPLLGIPNLKVSDTSKVLTAPIAPGAPPPASVNIPLFAVSGHVMHDASASYRGLGSDAVVAVSTIRFAQKYSTSVLLTLNNSAKSDGLLRHYGLVSGSSAPDLAATASAGGAKGSLFLQALGGAHPAPVVKFDEPADTPKGIVKRANSSGSEGFRSKLDLSTFTD